MILVSIIVFLCMPIVGKIQDGRHLRKVKQ